MIGTRLGNIATQVTLYTSVATLDGTGGASVAAWVDASGYYPAEAVLLFTNTGAAPVTIGNASEPAQLFVGGTLLDVLFGGREVEIDAGDSVWCLLPRNAAALGQAWAISAPMTSGATVSVSVVARKLDTSAPTAAEVQAAATHRYYLDDNITRNGSGLPTSARRRFFASEADRDAATAGGALTGDETEVVTLTWTYSGTSVTSQAAAG
jgi:hypothetical protein